MSLLTNLVAYWAFDELTGNALDSSGVNHLTPHGTTIASSTGKVSTCRTLALAASNYFSHADSATLSTGDIDFSFAGWVKLSSKPGGTMTVVSHHDGASIAGSSWILQWDNVTDRFQFQVYSGGALFATAQADTFGAPSTGVWYFVVVWHDSVNNQIGIRVNGQADTVAWTHGTNDSANAFIIGSLGSGGSYWDGPIDECGFWKKVLSTQEQSDLYASGSGLAFPFAAVAANTYYFSTSGSDANDGLSSATPWQTINKVNTNRVTAGDTLRFKGGDTFTFSGDNLRLRLRASGVTPTSLLPVTVNSYGTGQATISCGDVDGIAIEELPYVTIDTITVTGSGVTLNAGSPNTTTYTTAGFGIKAKNTGGANLSGITITGCTISGCYTGIEIGDEVTPRTNGFTGFLVTGNTVHDCVFIGIRCGNFDDFTPTIHASGTMSNNTVYNIYGTGTDNSGYPLAALATTGTLVLNNVLRDCGQAAGPLASGGPCGILLAGSVDCIIRGNDIARQQKNGNSSDGQGIDLDGNGCTGNIIERNYITGCEGAGITALNIGGTGSSNNTIRFNVIEKCLNAFLVNGATGSIIHGNTCYQTGSGTLLSAATAGTGTKFYNNVFITGAGTTLGTIVSGAVFKGNLYDCNSFSIGYGGSTYTSLAAFRTGSSQETGTGFQTSAGLNDAGNGPSSPATATEVTAYDPATSASATVGAGLDLNGLFSVDPGTSDYHGRTTHPGSGYFIGAMGFQAASTGGGGGRKRRLLIP